MKLFVFAATLALVGCGDSGSRVSESNKVQPGGNECCAIADRQYTRSYGDVPTQELEGAYRLPYGSLLDAHWGGSEEVLRVRVDTTRNRLWVLGPDHVDVYDIAKKHLIRRIALPGWSVAELTCQPDMALDRSGTAFISHNVQPRLWQINADSFQLKERVIRLRNGEHREIGFGGLAFTPDGTLFGVAASGGSLWSIDIANATAHQVELNALVLDACALTAPALANEDPPDRALAICAGVGSLSRRIDVSSDLARGRVVDESCNPAKPTTLRARSSSMAEQSRHQYRSGAAGS